MMDCPIASEDGCASKSLVPHIAFVGYILGAIYNLPLTARNQCAMCCFIRRTLALQAVTTAIGVQHGFGSSLFAMALCFSLIVMYDAAGVRRHAGTQAEVLNTVVRELLSMHAVSQKKLKEVLGHTPLQVRLVHFARCRHATACYSWWRSLSSLHHLGSLHNCSHVNLAFRIL